MTNFDHFLVNIKWFKPVKTTRFKPDRLKPEQPWSERGCVHVAPRCSCVNIINVMQHGPAVADTVGTPLYASFDQEAQI